MSELLENFSVDDLITPIVEQSSSTISLSDLDLSSMDLDFDTPNFPDFPDDLSLPSIDSSVSSFFDSAFTPETGLFNTSGSSFNSFAASDMSQFAPPQIMPMYAPQYSFPTSAFGYQPPPGFMLVPVPNFYAQQPLMPMMPMMENYNFSFTPAPDAPTFSSFAVEPEPMLDVSISNPSRRSRRTTGKKTTYQNEDSPSPSTTPVKRQKISRPKKADKPAAFELAAPLSVLTAESNLPLKNMLAFASRSAAVRLGETKKAGKISRSLNSFVCYRAAYADRIKEWASADNHQNISIVAGASWKIEPEDVRNFYIQCAGIDKANHIKAFPDYRYHPNRPEKSARAASPERDDDEPTPRPNKKKQIAPRIPENDVDDEMSSLFGDSPAPTPSKYNLRRR
ncbi:hypothetical protein QM012_005495 [Aureobasidium pullulans]|uniref:HMG box domain-containing protein n=1 Tax=Aureobasidium pullulans TaxID=5580 RepID=A0ABR0T4L8_AURPU